MPGAPWWGRGQLSEDELVAPSRSRLLFLNFPAPGGWRGSGPGSASPRPPRAVLVLPASGLCVAPAIPEGVPGPGSARGPLSMAAASHRGLFKEGVLSGDSDGGQGPGQGSRGASRPAQRATSRRRRRSGKDGRLWARRGSQLPAAQCSWAPDRDPTACPAPAQSRPRPNPIVPPGLGLASRRVPSADAGRAAPAAP